VVIQKDFQDTLMSTKEYDMVDRMLTTVNRKAEKSKTVHTNALLAA
jgi:hypothetical protein